MFPMASVEAACVPGSLEREESPWSTTLGHLKCTGHKDELVMFLEVVVQGLELKKPYMAPTGIASQLPAQYLLYTATNVREQPHCLDEELVSKREPIQLLVHT